MNKNTFKKTIRAKVRDIAFTYRMGAGFPGDVNRTHPATIEPVLIDSAAPPLFYGQPVIVDPTTQGVRPYTSTDTTTPTGVAGTASFAYGITVRPFPIQQSSASNYGSAALGAATPPASGQIDVMRGGYIMANLPNGGTPVKGGPVYIRIAASSGNHVQGTFEAVADTLGTNTVVMANATFNGSPDASGNVEIAFNI